MTHPDLTPTDQDRSRDLREDLRIYEGSLFRFLEFHGDLAAERAYRVSREGWPAAIRRALAAEAEVAVLRAYVGAEMLRSDYQTAAHMRAELERLQFRVAELEGTSHAAS